MIRTELGANVEGIDTITAAAHNKVVRILTGINSGVGGLPFHRNNTPTAL